MAAMGSAPEWKQDIDDEYKKTMVSVRGNVNVPPLAFLVDRLVCLFGERDHTGAAGPDTVLNLYTV